jgi:hypothetical protein
VFDGNPLDSAGQIRFPVDAVHVRRFGFTENHFLHVGLVCRNAGHLGNRPQLGRREITVPAQSAQHAKGELRIAIFDLRALGV